MVSHCLRDTSECSGKELKSWVSRALERKKERKRERERERDEVGEIERRSEGWRRETVREVWE